MAMSTPIDAMTVIANRQPATEAIAAPSGAPTAPATVKPALAIAIARALRVGCASVAAQEDTAGTSAAPPKALTIRPRVKISRLRACADTSAPLAVLRRHIRLARTCSITARASSPHTATAAS